MTSFTNKRIRNILLISSILLLLFGTVLIKDYFTKENSAPVSQQLASEELNDLVSQAIKSLESAYDSGEVVTEGHVILDARYEEDILKVYCVASIGQFGFENGVFTIVSGSGAIPTVITFSKNEAGDYSLQEYKEPLDGGAYIDSIKEMFPGELYDKVISTSQYNEDLSAQKREQAAEYLESIGRSAQISGSHVEKELLDIDVEASNKLIAEISKYNIFVNNCPYWIGTREKIEDGVRYIYETSQSKTDDGYDLVIFRKVKEDGTVIQEERYKIVGSEPVLLEN